VEPILTALLTAGSSQVLKALLGGQEIGRKDIAEVAVSMFESLLKIQNEQSASLSRIEAKLDRSLQQDFNRSYELGLYQLRDATHWELSKEDQDRSLAAARTKFLEAAAGTTSAAQQVQALHAAAGCSLLARRPAMARTELDDAWKRAYTAILDTSRRWENPEPASARRSWLGEFLSGGATKMSYRFELERRVEPLKNLVTDIQRLRRALGASVADTPLIAIRDNRLPVHPLDLIAESAYVGLPDGGSVRLGAQIDRPHPIPQFPNMPGAWVIADAEVHWPARPTSHMVSLYPTGAVEDSYWTSYMTTVELPPGRPGLENVHVEFGCTRLETLAVMLAEPFTGPILRIAFPI
jgi:hypothetical protein